MDVQAGKSLKRKLANRASAARSKQKFATHYAEVMELNAALSKHARQLEMKLETLQRYCQIMTCWKRQKDLAISNLYSTLLQGNAAFDYLNQIQEDETKSNLAHENVFQYLPTPFDWARQRELETTHDIGSVYALAKDLSAI